MKVKGHWCTDRSIIGHHSWRQGEPLPLFSRRRVTGRISVDATCRNCVNEEDLITAESFTPLWCLARKRCPQTLRHRRVSAKLAKHFVAKGEAFEGNEALSCSFTQPKLEEVPEDRNREENRIWQLVSKLKRPVLPCYCTAFHHLYP